MTEYDFSPEAYEQYLATQNRIAKWVNQTEECASRFGNPGVPSERGIVPSSRFPDRYSKPPQDYYDHSRSRQHPSDISRYHKATYAPYSRGYSLYPHPNVRQQPQPLPLLPGPMLSAAYHAPQSPALKHHDADRRLDLWPHSAYHGPGDESSYTGNSDYHQRQHHAARSHHRDHWFHSRQPPRQDARLYQPLSTTQATSTAYTYEPEPRPQGYTAPRYVVAPGPYTHGAYRYISPQRDPIYKRIFRGLADGVTRWTWI